MHRTQASLVTAVLLVSTLSGCRGAVPPPESPPGTQRPDPGEDPGTHTTHALQPTTTPETGGPFGFDRVIESCNSFSAHITNPTKTAWLDVFVAVKSLGLGPGEHALPIDGEAVTLTITELADTYEGEWSCTDVGGGPRPEETSRWHASEGTIHINLHEPPPNAPHQPEDGPYDRVDVELDNVHFIDEDGRDRAVSLHFEGLKIGWMPG